ncbi:MAG: FAD-binding protein [Pseudomonadales bacterium]|nr:FAD-binding protein [Pseudomonadales bacterium]
MLTRRRFLASTLLAAAWGGMPGMARASMQTPWRNWSGWLLANPKDRIAPESEDELITFLKQSSGKLRPVGAGHSFTPLVPTEGHLLVLDRLSGIVSADAGTLRARIRAGMRLGDIGEPLEAKGQAMYNLPDIDRQTLAGAISTSTHGTGLGLRSLSGYVTGLRLVTSGGDVMELSASSQPDIFNAARVSVGALGIITEVEMQNRAPFRLLSRTWIQNTEEVLESFDKLAAEWQHFELMPFLHADYSLVIAHKETSEPVRPELPVEDDSEVLSLIDSTPVMLRGALINSLATQIEPTESVLPSWNALTNVRLVRFNEMEYSVPAAEGPECLRRILDTVARAGAEATIPLEYRTIDGDDTWLGMCSGGPRVSISVHRMAIHDYRPLFDLVEPIFWEHGGRPHWGKIHTLGRNELRGLYPHFDDFNEVRTLLDPGERLLNPYLARLFKD